MDPNRTDITVGWQKRVEELRQILRNCDHSGKRLTNDIGEEFCERCGLKMEKPCEGVNVKQAPDDFPYRKFLADVAAEVRKDPTLRRAANGLLWVDRNPERKR